MITNPKKQVSMFIPTDVYWIAHQDQDAIHKEEGKPCSLGRLMEAAYVYFWRRRGEDVTWEGVTAPRHTLAQMEALEKAAFDTQNDAYNRNSEFHCEHDCVGNHNDTVWYNQHPVQDHFKALPAPAGVIQCDVCTRPSDACTIRAACNVAYYECPGCAEARKAGK